MKDKFKKLLEDDNSEDINNAAEESKNKVWSQLDINKKPTSGFTNIWKGIMALLILAVLGLSINIWLNKDSKNNLVAYDQLQIENIRNEFQHKIDRLSLVNKEWESKYILLEDSIDESAKSQNLIMANKKLQIEYRDKIQLIKDTIYLKPEKLIVYQDKIIRDTVFIEKIIEVPVTQEPIASNDVKYEMVDTKNSVQFDLRSQAAAKEEALNKKPWGIFSKLSTLN